MIFNVISIMYHKYCSWTQCLNYLGILTPKLTILIFIVSGLMFRSLIYFEFIFVYGFRRVV